MFPYFKWITKKNLRTGYLEEYRSCSVLLKSAAYHSLSRSTDIYVPLGSGSRSQITPPRSQVNWITSVSVSPSSLCHRCRNGAPTKGIDGRSKRRSGTRVLPRRRFDMSERDRSSPSCMEETTAQISEKREGAQAQKRKRRRRRRGKTRGDNGTDHARRRRKYRAMEVVQTRDLEVSARLINPGAVWRKWQERSRSLGNILPLVSATAVRV